MLCESDIPSCEYGQHLASLVFGSLPKSRERVRPGEGQVVTNVKLEAAGTRDTASGMGGGP